MNECKTGAEKTIESTLAEEKNVENFKMSL